MMPLVCLVVIGMSGQYCASPAYLVGECTEMNHEQYLCVADESELPLFLSIYDPAICEEHPINCDGDTAFGTGIPFGEEWYNVAAACPLDWVGSQVSVGGIGDYHCMDTGGRIHPQFRPVWTFEPGKAEKVWMWVIVVDVCYPHHRDGWPVWSLQHYDEWSRG
jgi:hypothetical protein